MNFNIKLNKASLSNLKLDSYPKDFTFIVNGQCFDVPRFVADMISPVVSKLHETDETINIYSLDVDNDEFVSEFPILFDLVQNQPIDIPAMEKKKVEFFKEAFAKLGNEHMVSECFDNEGKQCNLPLTIDNVFDRIEVKLTYELPIDKEVEFIAENLFIISQTKEEQLKNLNVTILSDIFSSPSLCIVSESWLLSFIIDLTKIDENYANLYEFLEFSEMEQADIEKFIDSFDFSQINYGIWKSVCKRLSSVKGSNSPHVSAFPSSFSLTSLSQAAISTSPSQSTLRRYKSFSKDVSTESFVELGNNKYEHVTTMEHTRESAHALNGIFSYLTSTNENNNINDSGIIEITSSSSTIGELSNIVDSNHESYSYTQNEPESWIMFDLKNYYVVANSYAIKSEPNPENYDHMKSWIVEGSLDLNEWVQLDRRENDGSLNHSGAIGEFSIQQPSLVRYIRVKEIGTNWADRNYLSMANFELFGELAQKV